MFTENKSHDTNLKFNVLTTLCIQASTQGHLVTGASHDKNPEKIELLIILQLLFNGKIRREGRDKK